MVLIIIGLAAIVYAMAKRRRLRQSNSSTVTVPGSKGSSSRRVAEDSIAKISTVRDNTISNDAVTNEFADYGDLQQPYTQKPEIRGIRI